MQAMQRYVEGELSLDGFVSHRLRLDPINEGFDLMAKARPLGR